MNKRALKEQAMSDPDLPALREEFLSAVDRRDKSLFTRQRLNSDARYCVWPNQSRDGRKWSAAAGQKPFPWPGASDARVGLVDKYVNEDVAFLMVVSDRMRVLVNGTESNDAAFAHRTTNLLRWMRQTQMKEVSRERRLAANYMLEGGSAVFGVFWDRQQQLGWESIDMGEIQMRAIQVLMKAKQGGQLSEMEMQVATLPNIIMDPAMEKEAIAAMQGEFPEVRLVTLRKAIRELRTKGATRLPVPYLVKNRPTLVALKPNVDIFLAAGTTDPQMASGWYRREVVSETTLMDRPATHDWDKDFVKEMIRTQRGNMSLEVDAQWLGRSLGGTASAGAVTRRQENYFEIIHAYRRLHDEDGVPGIYYTCFNPHVTSKFAYHGLLDYDHGEYPFIHIERESRSRMLDDARGYGEVAFTWQQQIKTQWDSRVDRASLATLPPSYFPSGSAPDKWGPGVQIPVIRPEDYGFMPIPKYDSGSQEVEESVRRFADEYFGRPVDEQNAVQSQTMRQDLANNWMEGLAAVDTQIMKLCQQFMDDEIFFRVVGSSQAQPLKATRDDIQGSFDVSVGFNVGDLDNEMVTAKLGLIEKALTMDTTGRVDRNNALDVIFELIDPDIGERVLKPAPEASQAEVEDEQTVFAKLMAGVDVDVKPEGQAYDLRLKVLEGIFQSNSLAQQAYQGNERVREVMDKRMKQLRFQLQQRENAIIGKLGA